MKILLAIDESEFSKEAIRTLIEQVRTKGTEVRVLHVVEPITGYMSADMIPHFVPYVAEVEEDRRKQAKGLVQRTAQKLREDGFKTSEIVDVGDPKTKIIDHAADWHADLIVVGSHGWKGLNRFLLGSVSESVARHAHCSVEVVRTRIATEHAQKKRARR
jgi:nucleotide-binding universal stress UspA family protein